MNGSSMAIWSPCTPQHITQCIVKLLRKFQHQQCIKLYKHQMYCTWSSITHVLLLIFSAVIFHCFLFFIMQETYPHSKRWFKKMNGARIQCIFKQRLCSVFWLYSLFTYSHWYIHVSLIGAREKMWIWSKTLAGNLKIILWLGNG